MKHPAFVCCAVSFLFLGATSVQAQETSDLTDVHFYPPSAVSMMKYIDYPVSHRTGIPEISIPLYTVRSGSLELPVNLSFHLDDFTRVNQLAGAAGALYGLNYSSLQSVKFNFNTSILVLVFVVLGGLGNIWGSLLSAAALTILPEALRQFADYRMLVYAIVLIFVMLATNNPRFKAFFAKLLPRRHSAEEKEV